MLTALARNFNKIATTSSVSLLDHLATAGPPSAAQHGGNKRRRPHSDCGQLEPLTKESRAWLAAAMRGDYQTLARLARLQGEQITRWIDRYL